MEETWNSQHSLTEFVAEDKFKSYDELKSRLDIVLGNVATPAMSAPSTVESVEVPVETSDTSSGEVEENLDYFKQLAEAQSYAACLKCDTAVSRPAPGNIGPEGLGGFIIVLLLTI